LTHTTDGLPVGEIAPRHRFDQAKLDEYLRAHIANYAGALTIQQFQGGASNPTFLLSTGPSGARVHYVMRKKPPGELLPSAHQVDREYRIMQALAQTDVPVPVMRVYCDDADVIGTAFYVMDFVPGRILTDPRLPDLTPDARAAVYDSFGDTMARLHRVDFASIDLADFGKPGDYIARQLGRFVKQYRATETEFIPEMEELIRVLPDIVPADRRTGIVHGDFKLGNMIIHPTAPHLVAVLDWELATLGDPLADLAFSALPWHRPADERGSLRGSDVSSGVPSERDFVRAYLRRTGRARIEGWNFYLAFAQFRLASIMQGVYRRVLSGTVASNFEAVNATPAYARLALQMLENSDTMISLSRPPAP
jgi:aminoglycoside phosphotransferase (APT) family kinase protein